MSRVAALFVRDDGPYVGRVDVDPWHLPRDARERTAKGVRLLGKREKELTPPDFAEVLISLARGSRV